MKRKAYKPRTAKCRAGKFDNPVEVGQSMTPKQMLVAFTRGQELPEKRGEYDENIKIDEVGYLCVDRLDAIDYMNSVNQRIAHLKSEAAKVKTEIDNIAPVKEETTVSNE